MRITTTIYSSCDFCGRIDIPTSGGPEEELCAKCWDDLYGRRLPRC